MSLELFEQQEFTLYREYSYGDGTVPENTILIVLEIRRNFQGKQEVRITPKDDLKKIFRDAWEEEMWFPVSELPIGDVITEE